MLETRNCALIAFGILFGAYNASAQTARISGRVTDASGAVVPATSITVTNVANGANRRVTTNAEGYYAVPLLLPGDYRVSVEHTGFKPIVQSGIVLDVDQRAELNFTLEVGGVSERVEVQAGATLLNTAEGGQGQVIENARIVELPLNGRTYDDLALGAPGAVQSLNGARFGGFSSGGMDLISGSLTSGSGGGAWAALSASSAFSVRCPSWTAAPFDGSMACAF